MFGKGAADDVRALDAKTLGFMATELDSRPVPAELKAGEMSLIDFLAGAEILASKSEAKRAIQGNAISVNKEKISDVEATVSVADLLHDKFMMVDNGKKKRYMVVVG